MANRAILWRHYLAQAIFALVLATVALPASHGWAQPPDDRPPGGERERGGGERGERGNRGWRRGGNGSERGGQSGGPGNGERGNRGRNREGNPERGGGENRPAESRPTTPSSSSTTAAPSSTSFGTVSENEKIRKSASDVIKNNDKNSNGILEGDELSNLGMSRSADKDGDGKITLNELVTFYSPKMSSSSSSSSTSSTASKPLAKVSSKSSNESKSSDDKSTGGLIVNTTRKSYRFKSTKDRQSSWKFSSKDADGDGQVSMSEFSASWSERTAAEFERYDKDNDGMITIEEAK